MMRRQFIDVSGANPHDYFAKILGHMLLDSGETDQPAFDAVGEIQARTAVVAEVYERGTTEQRATIIDRFGGRGDRQGKLDMDGAMFGLKIETATKELDAFLADLAVDELNTKMSNALDDVRAGKGVHEDAAGIGALAKAFLLPDCDFDAKKKVINASLTMQHATRALERLAGFHTGDYDREAASALGKVCNKINYQFDPDALVKANEELLFVCAMEMKIDSHLQRKPDEMHVMVKDHGENIRKAIITLIDVMPEAAKMYREAGKEELAAKAEQVHGFYSERYSALTDAPHVLMTKEQHAKHAAKGAPGREGMN